MTQKRSPGETSKVVDCLLSEKSFVRLKSKWTYGKVREGAGIVSENYSKNFRGATIRKAWNYYYSTPGEIGAEAPNKILGSIYQSTTYGFFWRNWLHIPDGISFEPFRDDFATRICRTSTICRYSYYLLYHECFFSAKRRCKS